eukprot:Gregarina_sp_Poly_1__2891@NODE_1808_length_3293_cov_7_772784_g1173_i0_p1_GENE_NODE_1808_length_3293_cov_7_772784_g1173_i0NODE_1808_length_3293_cov_7_772784_g1173_i0_p1_ORF_typecomplete_len493_score48_65Aldedh/PF00171_22/2_6e55_NODE_1808_length_3293_cov_7_772784_g1173_i012002678
MVVAAEPLQLPPPVEAIIGSKAKVPSNICPIVPLTKKYPEMVSVEEMCIDSPGLFDSVDDAVSACIIAQEQYAETTLEHRNRILHSIRSECSAFLEDFALCAWSETKRGRYEDKLVKQHVAVKDTPGTEELQPRVYTGDCGTTIIDYAPYGVIAAITPFTNPTATVINNSITILAGGNGVVFNPHPSAAVCTTRVIGVIHNAIIRAGGPPGLVVCIRRPTPQTGVELLTHPRTSANLVTGGPSVVKQALQSGKRSFCAGPGNPPVVVDETADLGLAARSIYKGASFDNGMICADEKEVFVVDSVADQLIREFAKLGVYVANDQQTTALLKCIFPAGLPPDYQRGLINREIVGINAAVLLEKIGVKVPDTCKLIITEVTAGHPLVWTEQLTPLLPIVRVASFEEGLKLARKAEYGYKHTSSLYSQNITNISRMARYMTTSIFVSNGAHYTGLGVEGEGVVSFSIAGLTGEGLTRPSTFVREKKLVCLGNLRFV